MKEIYTKYRCGDMSVLYLRDTEKKEEGLRVVTVLVDERVEARHYLEYRIGTDYLRMYSEVTALSDIGLEMLSSYNLCGFSCVGEGLRTQDFILHRMQSKWSMEGRLESENFPDLNLEPSWLRIGAGSLQ